VVTVGSGDASSEHGSPSARLASRTEEDIMGGRSSSAGQAGNAIYGIGMFGAWVYFWMEADGFWAHALAILEGIVWPAFAVYHGLDALGA
jgi:hypothetical protein